VALSNPQVSDLCLLDEQSIRELGLKYVPMRKLEHAALKLRPERGLTQEQAQERT